MTVNIPYHAAFLVPLGATRALNDDGWVFQSEKRLPAEIISVLTQELGLQLSEQYLGISVYQNATIKAAVTYDNHGGIEHVYFQVFDNRVIGLLPDALDHAGLANVVEVFVPSARG